MLECKDRNSHQAFFDDRDWEGAIMFWRQLIVSPNSDTNPLPAFVVGGTGAGTCAGSDATSGDAEYGLTDLSKLNEAGQRGEFRSSDVRYSKKKSFALRIGYDGTAYQGYQRQKDLPEGARTVEDDIKLSLGLFTYGAGRTDRGVSAISQVICCTSDENMTEEKLLERMRGSAPVQAGTLSVYDCQRVPKKFNSRSSATWRRYLYLFPLLPRRHVEGHPQATQSNGLYDVDVDFVSKMLGRLEGRELPYNALAYGEGRAQGEGLQDLCTLFKATAFVVNAPSSSSSSTCTSSYSSPQGQGGGSFMCVELVGTRFLRRQVRIMIATAVRESIREPLDDRRETLLVDICLSGDRSLAASPVKGEALCLAGVGYDHEDLEIYKFMPKREMQRVMEEREERKVRKRERMSGNNGGGRENEKDQNVT